MDQKWKCGLFYYNKEDRRILVPKKNQMGLTLNFAHPIAVGLFCFAFLAIALDMLFWWEIL